MTEWRPAGMRFRRLTTGGPNGSSRLLALVVGVDLYRCCCCWTGVGSFGVGVGGVGEFFSGWVVAVVVVLVVDMFDDAEEEEEEVEEGDEGVRSVRVSFVIVIVCFFDSGLREKEESKERKDGWWMAMRD